MSLDINDWLTVTRDERIVGKNQLLNEATKQRYFCMSKMWKNAEEKFRGGENLVDHIQGDTLGNAGRYNPEDRFNVSTRDTTVPISVPWAYLQAHYPVVREARELNSGNVSAFVNYMLVLEQGCLVDKVNVMEEECWALPNRELMEDANTELQARQPYSILSFITRDGLAPSATNGGLATGSSAWTTIQSINPTTRTWFRNQTQNYNSAAKNDLNDGIVPAMDAMIEEVQFDMPGELAKYAEDQGLQNQCIVTNLEGLTDYKAALRSLNDQMSMLSDPTIRGAQFNGVPVKFISELENAGWTAGQPDFLFINFSFLFPFVHTNNYMREEITPGGPEHPNKTVVWKFTWNNVICRSRRRQGRISAS